MVDNKGNYQKDSFDLDTEIRGLYENFEKKGFSLLIQGKEGIL
jgi:hypothetical protein